MILSEYIFLPQTRQRICWFEYRIWLWSYLIHPETDHRWCQYNVTSETLICCGVCGCEAVVIKCAMCFLCAAEAPMTALPKRRPARGRKRALTAGTPTRSAQGAWIARTPLTPGSTQRAPNTPLTARRGGGGGRRWGGGTGTPRHHLRIPREAGKPLRLQVGLKCIFYNKTCE